jgi:hypothetical protein
MTPRILSFLVNTFPVCCVWKVVKKHTVEMLTSSLVTYRSTNSRVCAPSRDRFQVHQMLEPLVQMQCGSVRVGETFD